MMKTPTQRRKIVCTIGQASDAPKTNGWPVHDQLLRTEELGTAPTASKGEKSCVA
jgi:hypothetical protein